MSDLPHWPWAIQSTYSRVGDLIGLLVLGNVKVDTDQNFFALQRGVSDGEFAREGHFDNVVLDE